MITIGLTGSIGMGKSTVAQMFRDEGIPVFDADQAVHALQGPGGRLVAEIERHFPGTTGPKGVDRQALGAQVFDNEPAMRKLEAIVHPAVGQERRHFIDSHGSAPLVVLDIPLLFETGGAAHVDRIVVVSADAQTQRDRVLARPGMTEVKFLTILDKQTPDSEKRARADHVIDTGTSLSETRDQVRALIACLLPQAGR